MAWYSNPFKEKTGGSKSRKMSRTETHKGTTGHRRTDSPYTPGLGGMIYLPTNKRKR